MRFSLIHVVEESGHLVSGYWIEDHVGTLASACEAARATEAANHGGITVAVVASVLSPRAALCYWQNLARLDTEL